MITFNQWLHGLNFSALKLFNLILNEHTRFLLNSFHISLLHYHLYQTQIDVTKGLEKKWAPIYLRLQEKKLIIYLPKGLSSTEATELLKACNNDINMAINLHLGSDIIQTDEVTSKPSSSINRSNQINHQEY